MNQNDIYDVFDIDGLLSKEFSTYEFRQGQLDMALTVAMGYDKPTIAALEAGTGIGKSFAYLVPAIMWSLEHPEEKTIIATSTINLQKQLYEKDIRQLKKMMKCDLPVALLLGRNNYLCQHHLQNEASKNPLLAQDSESILGRLIAFSEKSITGLRSDLDFPVPFTIWQSVCSDSDTCVSYQCPFMKECFYFNSRKEGAKASIIITNHHLLFSDAASRIVEDIPYDAPSVLPPFEHVIIDEAHNIEKNGTDYFTGTYRVEVVQKSIDKLTRRTQGTQRFIDTVLTLVPKEWYDGDIAQECAAVTERCGYLEVHLLDVFRKAKLTKLLLYPSMKKDFEIASRLAGECAETLEALIIQLTRISRFAQFPDEYDVYVRELKSHIGRLSYQKEILTSFFTFPESMKDVYWIEIIDSRESALHISPLTIADKMRASIFSQLSTVILTSATLDLHDEFAYWGERIGLPPESEHAYLRKVFSSPFDYKENLLLLALHDAPLFTEQTSQEYYTYMAQAIGNAVLAAEGGTLVLFTSYMMMTRMAQMTESLFKEHGLTFFRQGEIDRHRLLNAFIADENSVLFATDSFWEGIDAPGNTLRQVIIVKLPFRVPDEPVFRARSEYLDSQGKSGFYHLALPEATMKMKQGFGRLLRHSGDRGVVVILDSRLIHKSYGRWVTHALPESYYAESSLGMLSEKIELFLYQ